MICRPEQIAEGLKSDSVDYIPSVIANSPFSIYKTISYMESLKTKPDYTTIGRIFYATATDL